MPETIKSDYIIHHPNFFVKPFFKILQTFADFVAKYARIVITPDTPVDEDGKVEEDFKIHWYNKLTYANDYTITVDKKQVYVAPDLFATSLVEHNLGVGSCKTGTEFNIDVPERAALFCLIFKTDNIPAIYPLA